MQTRRRNTTSSLFSNPQESYWGQFEELSKYNVHLGIFERLWATWYVYIQNDTLATGIMSFVMHEIIYFGRALPWFIIDRIPYFNKYKIQNVILQSAHILHLSFSDAIGSKKYQRIKNNGIAQLSYCYPISQSSFLRYGKASHSELLGNSLS